MKKLKRKNPISKEDIKYYLADNSENFEYYNQGSYSYTYKFILRSNLTVGSKVLSSGIYIIKIIHYSSDYLNKYQIEYLKILSYLNLIPKIYVITPSYTIMKFIEGISLNELRILAQKKPEKYYDLYKEMQTRMFARNQRWWEIIGKGHGDLSNETNVIINKNYDQIYFIDPLLSDIHGPQIIEQIRKKVNL